METFEEYWAKGPGIGNLEMIPRDLALTLAGASYVAGQASAATWANEELKKHGI